MSLPKTILDIVKIINEKLEIAPKSEKIITVSVWDFRDGNKDTIPKMDLKNGLKKLAEDEKLFQLKDIQCLDRQGRFSNEKIELEVNHEKFKKFYEKYRQKKQSSNINKIEFVDDEPALKAGNKKCALPPFKNEHFFCRVAFEYKVNESVDWSVIYEKMTGYYTEHFGKSKDTRENWHRVYDTMEAINKRVKEVLDIDKLFVWQEKTIKRTQ